MFIMYIDTYIPFVVQQIGMAPDNPDFRYVHTFKLMTEVNMGCQTYMKHRKTYPELNLLSLSEPKKDCVLAKAPHIAVVSAPFGLSHTNHPAVSTDLCIVFEA